MARPGTFQKGHKKATGRPKGSPNKDTETVRQTCERLGLNVAEAMVTIALDQSLGPVVRFDMLKEIAPYCFAKLKHVEVAGSLGLDTSRQDQEIELLRAKVRESIKNGQR